jgi:hypothetical protein
VGTYHYRTVLHRRGVCGHNNTSPQNVPNTPGTNIIWSVRKRPLQFQNYKENKCGVLRTSHSINSQSIVSNDRGGSYCAPLPLDATNFENGNPPPPNKRDSLFCIWRRQRSVIALQRAFCTPFDMEPPSRVPVYA